MGIDSTGGEASPATVAALAEESEARTTHGSSMST